MLYKIEGMIRDKSPEERYEERQKQARPLLEAFFEWLHTLEDSLDRSSLIGEAILYTLNQEVYLKRYLEDGHLSIDNLAAERSLKNFATGDGTGFLQRASAERRPAQPYTALRRQRC